MTNHICPKPGCGMKLVFKAHWNLFGRNFGGNYTCPRSPEEHRLCKKMAELERQLEEAKAGIKEALNVIDEPTGKRWAANILERLL